MAALISTNGILTISNTTDTYGGTSTTPLMIKPVGLVWSNSLTAGARLVLQDADGVTIVELTNEAAKATGVLDEHFFAGMRPWKGPIKASVLTSGTVRLYL